MSLSDRFRKAVSDEDIPSVDSSRVLDGLGSTNGDGRSADVAGDAEATDVDEIAVAEPAALVAPPIASSSDDAPWRSSARVAASDDVDPVSPLDTTTDETTTDEMPEPATDDDVVFDDADTGAVEEVEVPAAELEDDDSDEASTDDAAGFKPWESPMSSGFESTLESLTAAMNVERPDEVSEVAELETLHEVGEASSDDVASDADPEPESDVAETVEEGAAEAAPPAAPALASPAFGRSKFGAMKRDGESPGDPAPSEVNGDGARDWARHESSAGSVLPSPVEETEDAAPPVAPRASVFAPSADPADSPRATSYGLGERTSTDAPVDPLASLKKRVEDALLRRIGVRLAGGEIKEEELRSFVERELGAVLVGEQTALSKAEREQFVGRLTDDLLGHGPMEQFLKDESVTEIMVSGLEPMYVERKGRLELTDVRFTSEAQLRQVIERIVGRVGRRIDESSPMVDARLPDGSRVNAIIPPLSVDGPALTIRKFSQRALVVDDLIKTGSLSQNAADMLSACVRGRLNILVTGGTGSGKTTMLNVLSSFIPNDQRIVTIEDAVELRLSQHHVIRLEARPPNIEGKGSVPIRELVRNSLRMRPDRIIVGEVRAGEALDMLQAMNTGHDGSLSTLHANTPRDVLARLETMVLMAGFELPVRAIREQIASAVDLIVHISRLRDGSRRVTHIVEVEGMEGEIITLTDLYLFDYSAGIDDDGRFKGELTATGLRPKFAERLADQGIEVPLPSRGFDPKGEIAVPAGFGWGR
jgi:pilus assembly protein CpaF